MGNFKYFSEQHTLIKKKVFLEEKLYMKKCGT